MIKMLILMTLMLVSINSAYAWNYPDTSGYKDVPAANTDDVFKSYSKGNAVIVDVRSEVEYNTAHIKGSLHIPVSKKNFVDLLTK